MEKLYFVVLALGQLGGPGSKDDIEILINRFNIRDLKHSHYSFCLLCCFVKEFTERNTEIVLNR
jgi:hypothetical protein